MAQDVAKPGGRDGSTPLMIALAGLIAGLVLFILFGVERSLYGVLPFALGGLAIGAVAGVLWARRRRQRRHGFTSRPAARWSHAKLPGRTFRHRRVSRSR